MSKNNLLTAGSNLVFAANILVFANDDFVAAAVIYLISGSILRIS